jgi:hypothetical protein
MKTELFCPDEKIIIQEDEASKMYLIVFGHVNVLLKKYESEVVNLMKGLSMRYSELQNLKIRRQSYKIFVKISDISIQSLIKRTCKLQYDNSNPACNKFHDQNNNSDPSDLKSLKN